MREYLRRMVFNSLEFLEDLCQGASKLFWQLKVAQHVTKTLYVVVFITSIYTCDFLLEID